MSTTYRFTKENTMAVKGIGILMLLSFHCFSNNDRITVPGTDITVDFWPFTKEFGMFLSDQMGVCVAIFAFLSVYGMTLSIKKSYPGYEMNERQAALYVIKKYLSILFLFFIPFLFCELVTWKKGFLSMYGDTRAKQMCNILMDMFCVSDIFGSHMIVRTWWYMSFLVMITVFMPALIHLYKRYQWLMIPVVLIPIILFLDLNQRMIRWIGVVPIAVCFADQRVFERLKEFEITGKRKLDKIIKFAVSTVVLYVLFLVKIRFLSNVRIRFTINTVMIVLLIYWCYEFFIELLVIKQVLQFLGRHSADMFFVHSFIRQLWYKQELYSLESAVLIYLVLLGSSLLISIALDLLRKLVHYQQATGWITGKVLQFADQIL